MCNAVSNAVQNERRRYVQNQNQNQTVVKAASGVSGHSCIASNGDLGAASCNATETIGHLDFTPPCDSWMHDGTDAPPASWTGITRCCGAVRIVCDPCLIEQRRRDAALTGYCVLCSTPMTPYLANVEPMR